MGIAEACGFAWKEMSLALGNNSRKGVEATLRAIGNACYTRHCAESSKALLLRLVLKEPSQVDAVAIAI